ncbi:MAG: hypothetical protein JWL77_4852 [Chthonomonadaceae bacterium]|nr:hypothetical protein [Chthonomonadaceae bacterium]
MSDMQYDIVVVGGSLGGAAAAWSAAQQGASVCLIEATGRLGGRFDSQDLVQIEEDSGGEMVGGSLSYRVFRDAVKSYYNNADRLFAEAVLQRRNPASRDCPDCARESPVEHQILSQFLAAHPNVDIRLHTRVSHVETHGDTIVSLTAVDPIGSTRCLAAYFLDATDLDDPLSRCGHEGIYRVPATECIGDMWESLAPHDTHRPAIQRDAWSAAPESRPDEESPPAAMWADWDPLNQELEYMTGAGRTAFEPNGDSWSTGSDQEDTDGADVIFSADRDACHRCRFRSPATTEPTGEPVRDAAVRSRVRQAPPNALHPRETGFPAGNDVTWRNEAETKRRADLCPTPDGASNPTFRRQARRNRARRTGVPTEEEAGASGTRVGRCEDACGIGWHADIDMHSRNGGLPKRFSPAKPFQIPLSALVPVRLKNLLPACKNLGATHLTAHTLRLRSNQWKIGEAAGALAAYCIAAHLAPTAVASVPDVRKDFQHLLLALGIPLFWWTDIKVDMPEFAAVHLLGLYSVADGSPDERSFRPKGLLTMQDRQEIEGRVGRVLDWPRMPMTRGQAALWLVQTLEL